MGHRAECRHCKKYCFTFARSLCIYCYRKPGIRERYPSRRNGSATYRSPMAGRNPSGDLAPEPTLHLPGTPEKAKVIEDRISKGLAAHHPKDAQREDLS